MAIADIPRTVATEKQISELTKDFPRDWLKKRKQGGDMVSYVEGWRVIDRANQIFGFDGWTSDIVDLTMVSERVVEKSNDRGKYRNVVVIVRARVRVTALGVSREDVGTCVGQAGESNSADAHDMAWKGAVTDALKRALRQFGMQFGLALYDKDQEFVGASLDAQSLLAEAGALEESSEAIKVWVEEHREQIAALEDDEKKPIVDAIHAKRTKIAIGNFDNAIANAKSESALASISEKAVAFGFEQRVFDRIAASLKARKTQLQRANAQQGAA